MLVPVGNTGTSMLFYKGDNMGIFKDLTGMVFGRLTVLKRVANNNRNQARWLCECSCDKHTHVILEGSRLTSGNTSSCGCLQRELTSKRSSKDLTGITFGRLTVLRRVENSPPMPSVPNGVIQYECQCSCPDKTKLIVRSGNLSNHHTLSCGCLQREATSDAKTVWRTPTEQQIAHRFKGIKQRCYDPRCSTFKEYGGRGIVVCDEWLDDKRKFVEWSLANGFSPELEIDRINEPPYDKNQDGPYAPWNCRWVTKTVNANNKRSNVYVDIDGVRHTIADWARLCGQDYTFMKHKYDRAGYDIFKDIVLYNLHQKGLSVKDV